MSITTCARLDLLIFLGVCALILAVSAYRGRRRRNRRIEIGFGRDGRPAPSMATITPAALPGDFVVRMVDFKRPGRPS